MARAEQELDILERISQILGDGLELREVFQRAMSVLTERLGIERAALVTWDNTIDQLRTIAAFGLTPDEMARGRYALGEGVTGQVLATGQPQVIADIARHPKFLNRTGSRALGGDRGAEGHDPLEPSAGGTATATATSFICVPIKDGDRYVGAISVDKPYVDDVTLAADARLLTIVAGSFAQTIRIHQLVQLEKDQWLAENQQLKDNLRGRYRFDNIIGSSPAMLDVLAVIGQVASSRATVLLMGETGCGKALTAKALH